ncbi:MAG: VPLPA-CTERM sorting domain-containing protein [Proteobacteria bacterium]|nr:VPLPA-CTERM sorting domain-containing protein [Pseudomonadota bacterium]
MTWQHFENDWPGTNNGHNDPVTVITSVDGIVAERYSWWHRPNSNIPLTITPGVPSTDNFTLTPLQARSSLWTVQSPNMANNYTTVIEFDDNGPPGAEWYEAKLDYTSNTPVPIPPAFLLLGPGLVGIAAIRRRLNK